MANRVLLGQRSGAFGLWVSKAGKDVLTATDADLLYNMERKMFQVVQWGSVSFGSATTLNITIPNQGFYPIYYLVGMYDVLSQIHFHGLTSYTNLQLWRTNGGTETTVYRYYVTNRPIAT